MGAVAAPETFKVYEKQLQISKGSKVKVKHWMLAIVLHLLPPAGLTLKWIVLAGPGGAK